MQLNVISYCVGISAREKGGQWRWALELFSETWGSNVEPDVTRYSA